MTDTITPEEMFRNDAIEQAITELIASHRTEFEQLVSSACEERGLRYTSAWLERFYKGM